MKGSFPFVAYGNASSVTNDETKRLQTITTAVQNRGARYTWASTTAVLGAGVGFMVEIEVGPGITGIWNVVHGGEVMGSFASPGVYRFVRRMTGGDIDGAVIGVYKSNDDSTSYSCSILGINVGVR